MTSETEAIPARRATTVRRATLGDVARLANVSLPTVSKVLNGHTDISEETRRRVQRALDELGYVRRPTRSAPAQLSVEVMVDELETPYAAEILGGVTLAAESADVDIVVSRFHRAAPDAGWLSPNDWARRLSNRGRTGAIVLTAQLSQSHLAGLTQEHLPVVVIDPLELTNPDVPSIGSTNWAGGYSAAEHLIALGHRRLGAIGGRQESVAASARIHGFRAACASAGVPVDESHVEFRAFDFESGRAVAERWLAAPDRPTGIVAASDIQALGVVAAAHAAGLRVPEDLSVVGYDDTHIAGWVVPALTTVRQPLHEMGRVALRSVLDLAHHRELDARHVELTTELVVRGSTAPPAEEVRGTR